MATKNLSKMNDEELAAEAESLAKQRTEIRLRQNEVAQQQQIRAALATLPPETRRIVKIELEGNVVPAGEPQAKAQGADS